MRLRVCDGQLLGCAQIRYSVLLLVQYRLDVRRTAVIRLYQPGPVIFSSYRYLIVAIDGTEVGELWPRQVKVFDVVPGLHRVQLRVPPLRWVRSREVEVTVNADDAVDFACWPNLLGTGPFGLHVATAKDKARMQRMIPTPPTPTDLGQIMGTRNDGD